MESPSLLVSSCPSLYDTWPVGTVIQACPTTSELHQTLSLLSLMKPAMPSKFAAEVIQCPTTTEEWTANAEQIEKIWQFPHCFGALDVKHVAVMSLEYWLVVQKLQGILLHCPRGLRRCRLKVSLD